jgi:hypothetical protein
MVASRALASIHLSHELPVSLGASPRFDFLRHRGCVFFVPHGFGGRRHFLHVWLILVICSLYTYVVGLHFCRLVRCPVLVGILARGSRPPHQSMPFLCQLRPIVPLPQLELVLFGRYMTTAAGLDFCVGIFVLFCSSRLTGRALRFLSSAGKGHRSSLIPVRAAWSSGPNPGGSKARVFLVSHRASRVDSRYA